MKRIVTTLTVAAGLALIASAEMTTAQGATVHSPSIVRSVPGPVKVGSGGGFVDYVTEILLQ